MAEKGSGRLVVDLAASPTFPGRKSPSPWGDIQVSRPTSPQIPPSLAPSSELTGTSSGPRSDSSNEQSKPGLQFKGDILTLVGRKRMSSSHSSDDGLDSHDGLSSSSGPSSGGQRFLGPPESPTPKSGSPARSPQQARSSRFPGRTIKTTKGHYSVAEKDVSVLERVSHRAHNRAQRVRKAHEVFIELEELHWDPSEELEWEETARWIKFEEDVDEGSGRWGRPHVSALAFHSLVDLRRGLEEGCIMLDLEGEDFITIAKQIASCLEQSGQLPSDCVEPLLQVLCKKHKHKHEVTLWEQLKKSATRQGQKLIRQITRHSHLDEMDAGDPEEGGVGSVLRSRTNSNSHSQNRVSLAPLLEGGPDSPTPKTQDPSSDPSGKKVLFNISGASLSSLNSPESNITGQTSTPGSSGTAGNVTESTLVGEISIDVDHVDQGAPEDSLSKKRAKEREAGMEQDQNHSHLGSLPVNKSVLSLMEKIPDEAESLTVLVGGVKFLKEPVLAFVRLAQSHVLGDLTEAPVPVRFLYLLLGPEDGPQDYHEVGRAMATLMSDKRFHEVAYSAVMDYDLLDAIDEFLDDSIVLPPGDWDQNLLLPIMHERNELRRRKERKKEEAEARQLFAVDPLKHTCRPCGGIWNDLKKLRKRYISDFQDAFHFQVFLTVIFLFITLIAPAIAFGGLMEEITLDLIGETETLVATGLCGIVYGLFAVQPLTILAFTGPVLLFEEIVHQFAESNHIAYLEWRACISLWLMLILIIFAISESTHLVTYFTRFSEEIFTGVVVIFFIFEVSKTIYGIYQRNPICGINYPCGDFATFTNTCQEMDNLTSVMDMDIDGNLTDPSLPKGFRICNQPNTALWSTILCLGTFFIAALLRKFRQGKFLGKKARRLMSDFGVFTALTIMVIVAYLLRNVIAVETLIVSSGFRPSNNAARGWFINPFGGRISVREGFAALGLGILLAILIFIENQLTVLVVNKPEHKLKKEVGYHFDLLIVAVLAGVCGLFGMPWMSAASIRSVQHIQALSVYSRKNAPGEKPVLKHVYEQRITNIAIHILIILSPLAYRLLRQVPVSVVVGVFLYLAYASINGVQLKTRIKLIFTPPKHFPDVHYVRKVPTLRMHLYTGIQVLSIAILWAIKLSPAAMIYPIAIVFLIPVRKFLGKFVFTHNHIEALDSHEDFPEDHEDGEGNEYDETNVPY